MASALTAVSAWTWLVAALAGWVFLGLVAGRFNACRRQIDHAVARRRIAAAADQPDPDAA